jgi:hypothetical protein
MLKYFTLVIVSISVTWLFAAEMVVKQALVEVPGDLTLIQTSIKDLSGQNCALVKINTDVAPFDKVESNQTPVKVINKTGEIWVYLSPGEKRLYFTKQNYARFIYDIPITLMSDKVYSMTILGKWEDFKTENVVTLIFQLNIEGVIISCDQKAPITANTMVAPFTLPKGKYIFKFDKEGYLSQTVKTDLTVDQLIPVKMISGSSQVSFASQGIITIDSVPTGAEVELNGQKVGLTPYQGNHYPGDYTLILRKESYQPLTRTFTLQSEETVELKKILLKPIDKVGGISVFAVEKLNPDVKVKGASIFIDGKISGKVTPAVLELRYGSHLIALNHKKYLSELQTVEVEEGLNSDITFKLTPYKGSQLSKSNFWKYNKWVTLGAAVLCGGAGFYYNQQGKTASDDYTAATTVQGAADNWKKANDSFKKRDTFYYASIGTTTWSLFSLIMQKTR